MLSRCFEMVSSNSSRYVRISALLLLQHLDSRFARIPDHGVWMSLLDMSYAACVLAVSWPDWPRRTFYWISASVSGHRYSSRQGSSLRRTAAPRSHEFVCMSTRLRWGSVPFQPECFVFGRLRDQDLPRDRDWGWYRPSAAQFIRVTMCNDHVPTAIDAPSRGQKRMRSTATLQKNHLRCSRSA